MTDISDFFNLLLVLILPIIQKRRASPFAFQNDTANMSFPVHIKPVKFSPFTVGKPG
jgi:hypothetical protein